MHYTVHNLCDGNVRRFMRECIIRVRMCKQFIMLLACFSVLGINTKSQLKCGRTTSSQEPATANPQWWTSVVPGHIKLENSTLAVVYIECEKKCSDCSSVTVICFLL